MATYYLTSTDVGAPTLSGTNGALNTVLTWIAGVAGMTVLYTGTNKDVFLMPDGVTRMRVVHDSAVSGSAQKATVRWAENATNVDTLVDEFPLVSLVADNASCWLVSGTANGTARPWWCLVDTTNPVFIFLVDTSAANAIQGGGHWLGASSMLPVDNYCSQGWIRRVTSTSTTPPPFSNTFSTFNNSDGGCYWKRVRDGTIKSTKGFLGPPFSGSNSGAFVAQGPVYPDPDDNKMRKERVFASDGAVQTGACSGAVEQRRAWFPHLWMGAHTASGYSGIAIGDTVADSAYDPTALFAFFPINNSSGSSGAILLEITDTWSAPTAL